MGPDHARHDELADAFALLFGRLPEQERRWRTAHALELVRRGDMDPSGVFVVRGERGPTGAVVCSLVEGAGSLIWPPGGCTSAEDALVRHACDWLRKRGARLTQCLLPASEEPAAGPLLRNGFRLVTHLAYMQHDLSLPPALTALPSRLNYSSYAPADPEPFRRTLELTYAGTLDCPELDGARSTDEVLRGHMVQGEFDPDCWWIARVGDEPVGVLMLMRQEGGGWEVVYMGVVPAWRGHGVGREMLMQALCEARLGGASRLMLSVDVRNTPAWRLYRGVGYVEYDRRAVVLAVWR